MAKVMRLIVRPVVLLTVEEKLPLEKDADSCDWTHCAWTYVKMGPAQTTEQHPR